MNHFTPRIASIAALAFAAVGICSAQQISVTINDRPVQFTEAKPQYVNGRVLVPLRGVFEQMGAKVSWNEAEQSVRADRGEKHIRLTIGKESARVGDKIVPLDVPAQIIDGSTMVPIRFLSEALGAQVGWNDSTRTVMLQTGSTASTEIATSRPERIESTHHMLRDGTVIPVRLDTDLSGEAMTGKTVWVTIDSPSPTYGGLPRGTKLEGHIVALQHRPNSDSDRFELLFDRVKMPNGKTMQIEGYPINLDANSVQKGNDGLWMARGAKTHYWTPVGTLLQGTKIGIRLESSFDFSRG